MSDLGEGIDREELDKITEADKEVSDESLAPAPEHKPKWADKFHEQPQTLDQMVRYPESCKVGSIQFKIFRLAEDSDTLALNQFMAQTEPEEAPQILIKRYKEEFDTQTGAFIVLVNFQRVFYRHKDLSTEKL